MKALNKINLSLYSVFSMLGGMTLPFLAGLLFYGEPLPLGKGVCFVLVVISLLFTVQKGDKKSGWLYYTGIFVLNGMSGVIAKAFNDGPYPKGSAADFSILSALVTVAGPLFYCCFAKNAPANSHSLPWPPPWATVLSAASPITCCSSPCFTCRLLHNTP